MKNIVIKDNLDLTKGFKLDDVAKKISIAVKEDTFQFTDGALSLKDEVFDKVKTGVKNAELQSNTLRLTLQDDTVKEVDLSTLTPTADIKVEEATLDGTTLKLTQSNGGPQVTVDLASFLETKIEGTDTTTVSGSGKEGDALKVNVKIASEDNLLMADASGLKVAKPTVKLVDTFGEVIGFAYETGKE